MLLYINTFTVSHDQHRFKYVNITDQITIIENKCVIEHCKRL